VFEGVWSTKYDRGGTLFWGAFAVKMMLILVALLERMSAEDKALWERMDRMGTENSVFHHPMGILR
jgi:hypothetical protein